MQNTFVATFGLLMKGIVKTFTAHSSGIVGTGSGNTATMTWMFSTTVSLRMNVN